MYNTIYAKHSNDRAAAFRIITKIKEDAAGERRVCKICDGVDAKSFAESSFEKYLALKNYYKKGNLRVASCEKTDGGAFFDYISGQQFDQILLSIDQSRNFSEFIKKIDEFREKLTAGIDLLPFQPTEEFTQIFGDVHFENSPSFQISNVDAIFSNILVNESWNVVDYEWTFYFPVPVEYVLYRAVSNYFAKYSKITKFTIDSVFSALQIRESNLPIYEKMERRFQEYVYGENVERPKQYEALRKPELRVEQRAALLEEQKKTICELTETVAQQQSQLDVLQGQYEEITHAFFWRVTGPLRRTLDVLKYHFRNSVIAHRLWQGIKSLSGEPSALSAAAYRAGESMTVLCTKHTLFVGRLVQNSLYKVGICADVITEEPEQYGEEVHIVICPQMFKKMPGRYIAFQMEQTVSSRWLTDEYFSRMSHAYSVFDYSLVNINYFKQHTEFGKNFYYLPIDYLPGYQRGADTYDYDVAFYGDVNNPRRKKMLEQLQEKFSVKIISEVFGEELYELLSRAKIVVNIHYYENAMLETTRLYEVLSLGRSLVVSERSSDPEEEKRLEGIVDFVDVGDSNAMIERIDYWLSHELEFAEKVAENNSALSTRANAFDYFFYRFLLANDWLSFDRFYELAGNFVQFKVTSKNPNRPLKKTAEI